MRSAQTKPPHTLNTHTHTFATGLLSAEKKNTGTKDTKKRSAAQGEDEGEQKKKKEEKKK